MEYKESIIFCLSDLPGTSFAAFQDMREKGELCDLKINVQNYSIIAHRNIVAAGIPYFRSLFSNNEVKNKEEHEVSLSDLSPEVLESIINFAYSGKINITTLNVNSLLQAADFFKLNQVRDACVEFLSQRLQFIRENFEIFSKHEDFLSLPESCVKDIIAKDDLSVSCEEEVFDAVINWVKISPTDRHAKLPELLAEVRMTCLPVDYLVTRVESEELIKTSVQCKDLVNEIKNYHLLKKKSQFTYLKTQPRKFKSEKLDVYAICFNAQLQKCMLYNCDFANKRWHAMSSKIILHDCNVVWHAVVVNNKIYLFLQNTIQTFHLKALKWEDLKARHRAVEFACILSHGNVIYCFGSDDAELSSKVRYFDTTRKGWLKPSVMNTSRWGCAGSLLKESIYISGGRCEEIILNRVDKFDPLTHEWNEVAPMLTARRSHSCISVNSRIYVCGGWTKHDRTCTAEVYNPISDQWNFISAMDIKRSSLSLISKSGMIYALGGSVFSNYDAQEVEIYDPECDQWTPGFSAPQEFRKALSIPVTWN